MKKAFWLIMSTIVLTACSTQKLQITQTGIDRYEIIKKEASYPGPGELQAEVTREARTFCASLEKKLEIIAVHETRPPFIGSKTPEAEIKFECLSKAHL